MESELRAILEAAIERLNGGLGVKAVFDDLMEWLEEFEIED